MGGGGKTTLILAALLLGGTALYAADLSAGTSALGGTQAGVVKYVPVAQKAAYALAAIIAVVSAVVIYRKIAFSEDADVKRLMVVPVLACVFLTASATALPAIFGIDADASGDLTSGLLPDGAESGPTLSPEERERIAKERYIDSVMSQPGTSWPATYEGKWNRSYIVAPDGTKVWISLAENNPPALFASNVKIGLSPEGVYKYYFEDPRTGETNWFKNVATPTLKSEGASLMVSRTGVQPYLLMPDGKKLYGEKKPLNDLIMDKWNYTVPLRFKTGRPSSVYFTPSYLYTRELQNAMSSARQIQVYTTDRIWANTPGAQLGKDPSTGEYNWYVTADNGDKVFSTHRMAREGQATGQWAQYFPQSTNIEDTGNGHYQYYIIADDGTKVYGPWIGNEADGLTL